MSKAQYLQNHLKKLNLTGMVDTLDIRVDQAQQESLGYLDFLGFLLQSLP